MADRDSVAIDIEEMLAMAEPLFTPKCCIYNVPQEIRQLNEEAYTPQVVSIGPLHRGYKKLLKMEGHKQVYCQYFIKRSEASLETLVSCVRGLEPLVRSCYSENIELGVDEFVKLILVDCGFIIGLFIRCRFNDCNDVILAKPRFSWRIKLDLLLLENQLPFFVFEELYNLAFASLIDGDHYPLSFLQLASHFYSDFNKGRVLPAPAGSMAHFTDLLRDFYLRPISNRSPPREYVSLALRYSASQLNGAGVKFTVNETSHSILDLVFSDHTLELPQIILEDSTEILLRNMVAWEQCHYTEDSYITDYIMLLDLLINADKDVDVLVKGGIVQGDNHRMAKLFKGLAKNILAKNCNIEYLRLCNRLNAYYEYPWHTIMATLRHDYRDTLRRDYCNTRWKTVATIGGIVLLILTAIQTVCSLLQTVQQV